MIFTLHIDTSTHRHIDTSTHRYVMLYLVVRHLLGNFQVLLSCFVIGLVENVNFIHKTNRSRVKYEIAVNYPYQYIATQTQHLKGVHKKGTNFRKEHYIW